MINDIPATPKLMPCWWHVIGKDTKNHRMVIVEIYGYEKTYRLCQQTRRGIKSATLVMGEREQCRRCLRILSKWEAK